MIPPAFCALRLETLSRSGSLRGFLLMYSSRSRESRRNFMLCRQLSHWVCRVRTWGIILISHEDFDIWERVASSEVSRCFLTIISHLYLSSRLRRKRLTFGSHHATSAKFSWNSNLAETAEHERRERDAFVALDHQLSWLHTAVAFRLGITQESVLRIYSADILHRKQRFVSNYDIFFKASLCKDLLRPNVGLLTEWHPR